MTKTQKLLLVLALAATSVASASPDMIVLRKTLKPGTETYRLVSDGKQTISLPDGGGNEVLDINRVATYAFKIGPVDPSGASAAVELTTKTEQITFTGKLAELLKSQSDNQLATTTSKGTLDNLNHFVSDDATKVDPMSVINGSTNNMIAGLFIQFPDKPVSIGDSWDVVVPKGPITGTKNQTLKAKLVSETQVETKTIYTVSLSGKVNTDIDIAELVKNSDSQVGGFLGSLNMVIKGAIDFDCEAKVDKSTGQTLMMTMKASTKQTMVASDKTFKSTGVSNVLLTLVP